MWKGSEVWQAVVRELTEGTRVDVTSVGTEVATGAVPLTGTVASND
jgi:hypothetical protein